MKKTTMILTACLMLLTTTVFANDEKTINRAAQESFKKEFGTSVNPQWQEIRGVYVAFYYSNGIKYAAYYDRGGTKLGSGQYITVNEMSPYAAHALQRYSQSEILELLQFSAKDEADKYFVKLVNGSNTLIVQVDTYGDIEVLKRN